MSELGEISEQLRHLVDQAKRLHQQLHRASGGAIALERRRLAELARRPGPDGKRARQGLHALDTAASEIRDGERAVARVATATDRWLAQHGAAKQGRAGSAGHHRSHAQGGSTASAGRRGERARAATRGPSGAQARVLLMICGAVAKVILHAAVVSQAAPAAIDPAAEVADAVLNSDESLRADALVAMAKVKAAWQRIGGATQRRRRR